jgi:hypothetical protein
MPFGGRARCRSYARLSSVRMAGCAPSRAPRMPANVSRDGVGRNATRSAAQRLAGARTGARVRFPIAAIVRAQATCISPSVCDCSGTGYSGATCTIPECFVAPANPVGCQNQGFCTGPDICSCQGAYEGPQCETFNPAKGCTGNSACRNGGTCVEGTSIFGQCQCVGLWDGPTCETSTSTCDLDCQHGGVCIDNTTGPDSCDCSGTPFVGTVCEVPTCTDPPCGANGRW